MKHWLAAHQDCVTDWCKWLMSVGITLAVGIWLGWAAGTVRGETATRPRPTTIETPSGGVLTIHGDLVGTPSERRNDP